MVEVGNTKDDDAFHGLFLDGLLPSSVVLMEDVPYVALSTFNRSRKVVNLINLIDGSISSLTPWLTKSDDIVFPYLIDDGDAELKKERTQDGLRSFSLMATDGKSKIIASRSSMTEVPVLVLGALTRKADGKIGVEWSILKEPNLSPKRAFIAIP